MATFCSVCKKEGIIAEGATSDVRPACAVLDGLADCLACNVNSADVIMELKLQRNAIILLAFLASSGKCGFESVLGHRLPKRINLLTLILQILASEDSKASQSIQAADIFRERTFLIREALIFLNRLVSNPQYSTPVLRALTNSRDVASLTIDIANRLSRQGKWLWQSDTMARQMRESEIVDLARVFKKRVFTFLGDSIS